jgi:DNA-binding beta-propeller fold protein YncE
MGACLVAVQVLLLGCSGAVTDEGIEDVENELNGGDDYEVWTIDQTPGAGKLYVYDGKNLAKDPANEPAEVFDLNLSNGPLCGALTGTTPVRAHMLGLNAAHTHMILANVATGHVVFMDTATRQPVACIDVGLQSHAAFASPDSKYVYVANQNGKKFHRISTDYATNTFVLEDAATIDLATCVTPNGAPCELAGLRPDNAPICPVIDSSSRFVFVTLRGGGLFVLDGTTTPMSIVAEYDNATIAPNGCVGFEANGRMYINGGGGTPATPTNENLYSIALSGLQAAPAFNAVNLPTPNVIYDEVGDSHGGAGMAKQHGKYLWVADRMDNEMRVIDTELDVLVNTFSLVSPHSADPTPDLMFMSPDAKHVFMALRGPCPLTGNSTVSNNAVGSTPGVLVAHVEDGGLTGTIGGVAPINDIVAPFTCTTAGGSPTVSNRADPHGLIVVHR